jgi:hypothetical protein
MTKSICIAVSFDGSSDDGYKIVMQHTDGSLVTLTTLAVITRAGMNFIPAHLLREMFASSGALETEAQTEIGNNKWRN